MMGASDAAVEVVADLLDGAGITHPQTGPPAVDVARGMLDAAHDAALGLDRSVCLRDVIDALDLAYHPQNPTPLHPVDFVRREFGGE
jgi:hypothetical protein